MGKPSKAQLKARAAIQEKGRAHMLRLKRKRLLDASGQPIVITCTHPAGQFGFAVREVDPVTRALIDAACAQIGIVGKGGR
jgi:hypothetical protein